MLKPSVQSWPWWRQAVLTADFQLGKSMDKVTGNEHTEFSACACSSLAMAASGARK
jgi:hypothetical protein